MTAYVPTKCFLVKGVGTHKEKLQSFEGALRNAGIAQFNLVRVSSIFPPHCKILTPIKGLAELDPGMIIHCVLSDVATNEPHRLISASVGIAIPKNRDQHGYLSEHHGYGQTEKHAGDYAEDLAAEMLATIVGVPFDPDKSWNERKEIWKISDDIVLTRNTSKSAVGNKNGLWTTVLAGAIFVP
ncbi:arginine decarboxylase, pyruvoyl-dependent [bacterium]|nr:arginine decarboxylase, pyruvoyl-dependent [bacterium]MCG2718271.1 arginine decarboxylase, pyruvoyl-dependent [Nanoarchaeota archaeon]